MNSTRIVGLLRTADYHRAKAGLELLSRELQDQFSQPECVPLLELQWTEFLDQLRKEAGSEVRNVTGSIAVFCNQQLIGDLQAFLEWASQQYDYQDQRPIGEYETLARDSYNTVITNPQRKYVFMDMFIEGDMIGRLVMELYTHLCPRTCENFVSLCVGDRGTSSEGTKLSYVNTLFHRVIKGGWLQAGDICGGSGAKGESIFGKTFDNECFAVAHDRVGVLGMANHGRNTNSSQFYITLKPAPWMDKQYVAFGCVVEGKRVLEKLEAVETYNERPKLLCQVSNCGILQPTVVV